MLATFLVDNLDDGPVNGAGQLPGALRQAIFDANNTPGADVIQFAPGLSGAVQLTAGELEVTDSVDIQGPGALHLTIVGDDPTPDNQNGDGHRVFNVDDGDDNSESSVTISGLTITGGDVALAGGGVRNVEDLTLRASHVTGNSASTASSFLNVGGGVYSSIGTLTIENSTISNNYVYHDDFSAGGGIAVGEGNLVLRDSTISGNRVRAELGVNGGTAYGGGILLGPGSHLISFSTINNNQANGQDDSGGGITVYGSDPSLTLTHSIVANNLSGVGRDISSTAAVTTSFSLVERSAGWVLSDGGGNLFDQDPNLSDDLTLHGGPTPTHAVLAGSPAIDAGDPGLAILGTDQRGGPFNRAVDGDSNGAAVVDMGAYERQTLANLNLVVDTVDDEFDGDFSVGDLSLREAVGLANGSIGPDAITFDPALDGQSILLDKGELRILDSVSIDAAAAGQVAIDAIGNDPTPGQFMGDGSRVFLIDADDSSTGGELDVSLTSLLLTGGDVDGDGGGILSISRSLSLDRVTVHGNAATRDGGGVFHNNRGTGGAFVMDQSTISGNVGDTGVETDAGAGGGFSDPSGGGGLKTVFADAFITSSTISGNRVVDDNGNGGGAMFLYGDIAVRHSTITGNAATGDGGAGGNLYFLVGGSDALLLDHTIVANGTADSGNDIATSNDPVGANNSLIEDASGLTIQGAGNITGLDPVLGPLAENGGPTRTHALLPGSPAIDGGAFTFTPPPDNDQRGAPFNRLVNGDGDAFTIIDIGAYERQTLAGQSLVVDTTRDENDGDYSAGDLSLREAIGLANGSIGADVITFDAALVGKTITLTRGDLPITDTVDIDAISLGGRLTISGAGNRAETSLLHTADRIFTIDDGDAGSLAAITLSGLTLEAGLVEGQNGGAILNREDLTVNRSTLRDNRATSRVISGGLGGAIHSAAAAQLTINDSTLSGNVASRQDNFARGGAVSVVDSTATINNSTISGNSAFNGGGGVYASGAGATVTANHSTIAGNSSANGPGGGFSTRSGANVTLNHTIVADNVQGLGFAGPDIFSNEPVNFAHSLVENGGGFTASGGPQIIGQDPRLGPLANYGGLTQTHALMPGSPAIDAGNLNPAGFPAFDQRGAPFVRVFDGNNDSLPRVDIGAFERFELADPNLVVDTIEDLVDGDLSPGDVSLREAIGLSNGSFGNEKITFAATIAGQTIGLLQGELPIIDDVEINASSLAQAVTIDASPSDLTPSVADGLGSRIFNVDDLDPGNSLLVILAGLTLTGGDVAGDGGAVLSNELLDISHSTIRNNVAFSYTNGAGPTGGRGGGVAAPLGRLDLFNSAVHDNRAAGAGLGGGVYAGDAFVNIFNSTLSSNVAASRGGGVYVDENALVNFLHATVSDNTAEMNNGGGLYVDFPGSVSLDHSIVANNAASAAADIFASPSSPILMSYSLVESTDGYTPTGSDPRITGVDPMLGPLADNGGRTVTHALLEDSPAIDQGNPALTAGVDLTPEFDQRGAPFSRIANGLALPIAVIDYGAYEFNPAPPILPGDYNNDGVVDSIDYAVWRENLGSNITLPNEDPGATPGMVTTEDFQVWRDNYGPTAAAATASIKTAKPTRPERVDPLDRALAGFVAPVMTAEWTPGTLSTPPALAAVDNTELLLLALNASAGEPAAQIDPAGAPTSDGEQPSQDEDPIELQAIGQAFAELP